MPARGTSRTGVARLADQVVVRLGGVGVVPLGPVDDVDHIDLAQRDELVERVVDGRAVISGNRSREVVDLLRREVHMLAGQHLGHDASLRAEPPRAPQPGQQVVLHEVLRHTTSVAVVSGSRMGLDFI